jgi:hypothetical protein
MINISILLCNTNEFILENFSHLSHEALLRNSDNSQTFVSYKYVSKEKTASTITVIYNCRSVDTNESL